MLYTKNSFASYSSLVFDNLDLNNFTPGYHGVTLAQLRTIDGVGARAIAQLSNLLGIPDDAEVLRFNLSPDFDVRQTIAVSVIVFVGESGNDELTLSIGNVKFPYTTVVKTLKSKNYAIAPDLITIAGQSTSVSPCISIYPVKSDGIPLDSEKLSFEIIPAGNDNAERTTNRLAIVDFLKSKHIKDLADAGIVHKLNLESGNLVFAKLKELPIGDYECSNLKYESQKTIEKDGKQVTIFPKWRFIAKSYVDGTTYGVDAAPSSFIGQTVDNDGRYLNGKFHLLIKSHRVIGKTDSGADKISVVGQMNLNIAVGRAIAQRVLPTLHALVPSNGVVPVLSAAVDDDTADIPF